MKCQSGFSVCGVSSVNLGCGVSVWDGIIGAEVRSFKVRHISDSEGAEQGQGRDDWG